MATVERSIGASMKKTGEGLRRAAASHGWALAEGESNGTDLFTFKKGVRPLSWGSKLIVKLKGSGAETNVTVSSSETWALTDWGRGRREANRLLAETEKEIA
jgi:hypothetical protein